MPRAEGQPAKPGGEDVDGTDDDEPAAGDRIAERPSGGERAIEAAASLRLAPTVNTDERSSIGLPACRAANVPIRTGASSRPTPTAPRITSGQLAVPIATSRAPVAAVANATVCAGVGDSRSRVQTSEPPSAPTAMAVTTCPTSDASRPAARAVAAAAIESPPMPTNAVVVVTVTDRRAGHRIISRAASTTATHDTPARPVGIGAEVAPQGPIIVGTPRATPMAKVNVAAVASTSTVTSVTSAGPASPATLYATASHDATEPIASGPGAERAKVALSPPVSSGVVIDSTSASTTERAPSDVSTARPAIAPALTATAPTSRISGRRAPSSAAPTSGPVASCGNVEQASSTPPVAAEPVRCTERTTIASTAPSVAKRAVDPATRMRHGNVFKR